MPKRKDGQWYWVTDGENVWRAKWSDRKWTNEDTWEDFQNEVKAWQHIPEPTVEEVMSDA